MCDSRLVLPLRIPHATVVAANVSERRAVLRHVDDGRRVVGRDYDNLAIGTIAAARTRGLRVPQDVSVVGFDDIEHATIVTPSLTTVRQPLEEMGRMAVSILMRLLEKQRFETLRVELAPRLVVRESTGPPSN
ncbi:MAG: hypothetical protein E6G20_12915 [Actinobacteria bacterium]|nr:MAG: hypothetical protein E6G20_12915 [Actinomycetota bacterium]